MFQRVSLSNVFYCHDVMVPEHHQAYVQLKQREPGECPETYFDRLWAVLDSVEGFFWLPESSVSPFYHQMMKRYGAERIRTIHKYDYVALQEKVLASGLQRDQRKALMRYFEEYDRLSMRYLKPSQRKAVIPYLYQPPEGPINGVIVDDALFTGSTVHAIRHHLPHLPAIHLFGARYPDDSELTVKQVHAIMASDSKICYTSHEGVSP